MSKCIFTKYNLKIVKESSGLYEVSRQIGSPKDIYKVCTEVLDIQNECEEIVVIITLDTKNNVTGIFEVSRGTVNSSLVHPREIFKRAMFQNAAGIAMIHNHPSGDPEPSQEDKNITKRIYDAGELLGISLIDHIIIGDSYLSMRTEGYFCQ